MSDVPAELLAIVDDALTEHGVDDNARIEAGELTADRLRAAQNGNGGRLRRRQQTNRPAELLEPAPQNLDAEENTLGAMLLSPNAINAVRPLLEPANFYRDTHGRIFRAIVDLHASGKPADAIAVVAELEQRGQLADVGGQERVHELAALVPATSNAAHYAGLVRKEAERRRLAAIGDRLRQSALDPTADLIEIIAVAADGLANVSPVPTRPLSFVQIGTFAGFSEELQEPLLGSRVEHDVVISANGNVMLYGDGGAGKTTLEIDLVAHLGAGLPWNGIAVPRPIRQLIVENEGDRAEFRAKLDRKLDTWTGPDFRDNVYVLDEPWGDFTLADDNHIDQLAAFVREHHIDLIWMGPGVEIGMTGAGTPADVSTFNSRVGKLRRAIDRQVAIAIPHHENKGGDVSGAWDRWPATLIHVEGEKGTTKVTFRKTRHASARQHTTMVLTWAENERLHPRRDRRRRRPQSTRRSHRDLDPQRSRRPRNPQTESATTSTSPKARSATAAPTSPNTASTTAVKASTRSTSTARSTPRSATTRPSRTPHPHPATKRGVAKTRGQPTQPCAKATPRPATPAIQTSAGYVKASEQGKSPTPHPALSKERDHSPAGSRLSDDDLEHLEELGDEMELT